jgi:hypothetical protein
MSLQLQLAPASYISIHEKVTEMVDEVFLSTEEVMGVQVYYAT